MKKNIIINTYRVYISTPLLSPYCFSWRWPTFLRKEVFMSLSPDRMAASGFSTSGTQSRFFFITCTDGERRNCSVAVCAPTIRATEHIAARTPIGAAACPSDAVILFTIPTFTASLPVVVVEEARLRMDKGLCIHGLHCLCIHCTFQNWQFQH